MIIYQFSQTTNFNGTPNKISFEAMQAHYFSTFDNTKSSKKKDDHDQAKISQMIQDLEKDFKVTKYYLNALLSPNNDIWIIYPGVPKQVDVLEDQKTMWASPINPYRYKIEAKGQTSPLKLSVDYIKDDPLSRKALVELNKRDLKIEV